MRYALLLSAVIFLQNPAPHALKASSPQHQQAASTQQPTGNENRGTQGSPIFIKQLPPEKTQPETDQEAKDREEKAANDRNLVKFTLWLVIATLILAGVGILQLFVFGEQARQLRKTVKAAADQSDAMERSIAEAARAAKAMEDVATHFDKSVTETKASTAIFAERGQMQMRAYISVLVGNAVFQERDKNLKFQAIPALLNAGSTPAHKVRTRTRAAILPIPTPEDFDFPLPEEPVVGPVMGPHQQNTASPILDSFVEDTEVEAIKLGNGKALHAWGIVSYEDVFGNTRQTRFSLIYTFLGKAVQGYYTARHNDAT